MCSPHNRQRHYHHHCYLPLIRIMMLSLFLPPPLFCCWAITPFISQVCGSTVIDHLRACCNGLWSGCVVEGGCRWIGVVAPVAAPWLLCACTAAIVAMFMHGVRISHRPASVYTLLTLTRMVFTDLRRRKVYYRRWLSAFVRCVVVLSADDLFTDFVCVICII